MTTECCVAAPLALEIVWQDGQITSMRLAWGKGKTRSVTSEAAAALQAALERYIAGEPPEWPELPLRWDGLSPFARQVMEALCQVPYGQKVSYGWLAAKTGHPKAARAVGRVMAGNPFPLLVPCHRVVGASGALTGFGPGVDMKKYLLEHEGA